MLIYKHFLCRVHVTQFYLYKVESNKVRVIKIRRQQQRATYSNLISSVFFYVFMILQSNVFRRVSNFFEVLGSAATCQRTGHLCQICARTATSMLPSAQGRIPSHHFCKILPVVEAALETPCFETYNDAFVGQFWF